jgi:hypothetical protein
MSYQVNTNRPPFKVEAFQWDGLSDTKNWPSWTNNVVQKERLEVIGKGIYVTNINSVMVGYKKDFVVLYPSGNLAIMKAKDFNYNFKAI